MLESTRKMIERRDNLMVDEFSMALQAMNERLAAEALAEARRRDEIGEDGRRFEDYGKLWAEMQQGAQQGARR